MARTSALLIAALAATSNGAEISASTTANPIRRVVTMIQNIQKKVEKEAEEGEELHNKFMCYCKNGAGSLETSIAEAEAKIGSVKSALEEAQGEKKQLIADLAAHKDDRAAAKDAIAKATAIRAKEAATFAAFKAESETNVAAIGKAVASLEKGMAGAFLQTTASQTLRNLLLTKDMQDGDRNDVMAFLSGEYAPQSGQITGILKQLSDEMNADLTAATNTENEAIKSFDGLVAAKTKEIEAATVAIEAKSIRLGETSVSIAEMTGDLGDTVDSLADDKKFLADLEKNCATAQEKYDAIVTERSAEIVALSETIKILNDDDALELFKKTLPSASASFVQLTVSESAIRKRALNAIKAVKGTKLDFIALALNGKKIGFGKVIAMIDEMAASLKKEQGDDDSKKEYCAAEFDQSDDKKKAEEQAIADAEAAIDDAKETLAKLTEEIKALQDSIIALDKSVADATEQRKADNADYSAMMAGNTAAKELIGVAKNRLNKFYNPKLYVAPPKRELSEEERIAVSMGETMAPTPAPGGIAGTGISAFVQDAADPGPAPAQASYGKKSEERGGVIAMLDLLIKDLDKEMQTGEAAEKDAQGDYETAMADAATKRADDTKTLGDKESAKAETESALQGHQDDHAAHGKELMGVMQYISGLHGECDWLLKYFDQRKEARSSEIDALGKAKAVLSGADFSLLQKTASSKSLRGHM
jgi:chromosome segregation ATPase